MRRLRGLWLAILLTISAASSTGLAVAGVGATATRDISSVPGLANALAHSKKHGGQRPVTVVRVSVPGANTTLPLGFTNIVPGQSITREVTITNTGDVTFKAVTVHLQVTRFSPLLTNQSQGLALTLTLCAATCISFINSPLASLIGHSVTHGITLRPGQSLRLVTVAFLPANSTLSNESGLFKFSGVLST